MLVSTSEKLKDYENYVIKQITDIATVEKVVYSQFTWLYSKSGLKSMLEFITLEFAKYKNGDGNRFEDWLQEYRVLMLELLEEYQEYHLCDIGNEMTEKQLAHFDELYANGATAGELFFKALSWWACGILRNRIRRCNVTKTTKHKHCSNDLFIDTDAQRIFSELTVKEQLFIQNVCKQSHLIDSQFDFVVICYNCSQVDCYDFTTELANALHTTTRNIRKTRQTIRNKYEKYKK